MEYFGEENRVHLSGRILTAPVFSHKTYGEAFYLMMLGAFRKSGREDRIRLIVSERITGRQITSGRRSCGPVRTDPNIQPGTKR